MPFDPKHKTWLSKKDAIRMGHKGWHSRGYLPHFSDKLTTQSVTFRLFDSMPQEVLKQWELELQHLPKGSLEIEKQKRIEEYLDRSYGCCYLKEPAIASKVQEALLHFDHDRYALHAWVIMPNHVHTLFSPRNGWEWGNILHSWRSYTANECNKILGRSGTFWMRDPHDRYIRDEQHYSNAMSYIENNPVKAGLCTTPQDWQWSSASWDHQDWERPHPAGET